MNCQETAGFLFKHKCGNEGEMQCDGCHRWVCLEHAQQTDEGNRCITCAKAVLQAQPRNTATDVYDNSPYFYSYRYSGFGSYHSHWHSHDRNDFVEGDGAAFVNADADRFEDDLDAS